SARSESFDPSLDTPMDAKAFFNFVSGEPQDAGNLIRDTIFKAVIGLRFSKNGTITRREVAYLREIARGICEC
ncbi:MAG: hypothetical protein P4L95_03190, partial [Rouxiella aceris]|uniref:hypothetical protein n=1 Tax=Rouxiella aceris TaxID=2703884 RepID=UPI00284C390C